MLREVFTMTFEQYADAAQAARWWSTLAQAYESPARHYHNIQHLEALLGELQLLRDQIGDWDAVVLAIAFHDVVYDVKQTDNEAQSAVMAVTALQSTTFSPARIQRCEAHIRATQGHQVSADADTNLFTDADLSILGATWPTYQHYANAIRKEYALYPDVLYQPGRKKVLQHFLSMEKIFKTTYFFQRYEKQARANLAHELSML